MRMFAVFILMIFVAMAVTDVAFADSCPYCGMPYGEGAPGDEAYIASIRAEHEANCPSRSQATSGEDDDDAGVSQGGDQSAWLAQQQWIAEQERYRQAQERDRKERIEREARERAEVQAQRLEWERKKEEMISMVKGDSTGLGFKSTTGTETVELKPKGTAFFGIPVEDSGKVAVKVGGKRTPPSTQQLENARRALWLYQKASKAESIEETHFLAAQAAEAMQGHALRVEVPAQGATPQLSPEKIIEFKEVSKNLESNRIQLDEISKDVRLSEDKKNIYQGRKNDLESEIKAIDQDLAKPEPKVTPAPGPPPTPAPTPEPEVKTQEEEKKKKKEDLMKELEALKKLMEENENTLKELKQDEKNAQSALKKSEKKFEEFTKKA